MCACRWENSVKIKQNKTKTTEYKNWQGLTYISISHILSANKSEVKKWRLRAAFGIDTILWSWERRRSMSKSQLVVEYAHVLYLKLLSTFAIPANIVSTNHAPTYLIRLITPIILPILLPWWRRVLLGVTLVVTTFLKMLWVTTVVNASSTWTWIVH